MNARQKAKMYKRMYEHIASEHVTDTLRLDRLFRKEMIDLMGDDDRYFKRIICGDFVNVLESKFNDYFKCTMQYDQARNLYHFRAQIEIKNINMENEHE